MMIMDIWYILLVRLQTKVQMQQIPDRASMQTDGYGQKYSPLTTDHPGHFPNQHPQTQCIKPMSTPPTTLCPCYTYAVYGHLSKNCPQANFGTTNIPTYVRSTPPVATPSYVNGPNTHHLYFPKLSFQTVP